MIPSAIAGEVKSPVNGTAPRTMESCSPLAQLLHALNQPLTGLQCSMEVALAGSRTVEQYVQGLRDGLELTERMRNLVEAIREIADVEEEKRGEDEKPVEDSKKEKWETIELRAVLQDVVSDLEPVAEVKNVGMVLECSTAFPVIAKRQVKEQGKMWRPRLTGVVFRLLESALSLAAEGSMLRIEARRLEEDDASSEGWLRVRWQAEPGARRCSAFSKPELGLLVAQAGWERAGAAWERERTESAETVTIRMREVSSGG